MENMNIEAPKNAVELIAIQSAAIRGFGATRGAMHKALVQTLLHIAKHGDYNGAKQFLIAIKKDDAAKAIAKKVQAWLENYGGMVVSTDRTTPDTFGTIVGWKGKDHIVGKIEEARANPYYAREAVAKAPVVFDVNAEIDSLVRKINSAKLKGEGNIAIDPAKFGRLMVAATMTAAQLDAAINCTQLAGILEANDEDGEIMLADAA